MNTDLEKKPRHMRAKKNNKKLTKTGKVILISIAVLLVALIALTVAFSVVPADTIANGIYVGDLNLSGKTMAEAKDAVAAYDFDGNKVGFSVSNSGKTREIAFADVDMTVDAEKIAENAFSVCHTENKFENSLHAIRLRFSKLRIPITHKVDTLKLDTILSEFGAEVYGTLKQHEITVADDYEHIVVTPGVTGCGTNVEKARTDVLNSVAELKFDNINIELTKESPKKIDINKLETDVYRDPQDAKYVVQNREIVIVDEVVGIRLDKDDALSKIDSIKEGGQPVEIKVTAARPNVNAETLRAKMFNAALSSYTTKYNPGAANRSKNVALAAEKINGTVLAPGDEFSYNDVVGKRTAANGFLNAPVYENGKSVDGIGGGVCQVSTTLYSAVLYADLEVTSRQNHSKPVSYVPLGQDATVVDGYIDFKFKNNTDYPIKIVSSANKGVLSVEIIGTKRDTERTVKVSHTTVSVIPPTSKETKVAELPLGERVVTSKGKNGYVIESTKTVYENGALVRTESLGRSTYKMTQEEVNVGTGTAVPAATAAPQTEQPADTAPTADTNLNTASSAEPVSLN